MPKPKPIRVLNFAIYLDNASLNAVGDEGKTYTPGYGKIHLTEKTDRDTVEKATVDGIKPTSHLFSDALPKWGESDARGFDENPNMSLRRVANALLKAAEKLGKAPLRVVFFAGAERWEGSSKGTVQPIKTPLFSTYNV